MLRRVSLALLVVSCLSFPIPLSAQSAISSYVQQLQELGYSNITVSKTFLGRYRILAQRGGATREMVVARNGQLMFDYFDASRKGPSAINGNLPPPSSGGGNSDSTNGQQQTTSESSGTSGSTTTVSTPDDNGGNSGNNGNNGNGGNQDVGDDRKDGDDDD